MDAGPSVASGPPDGPEPNTPRSRPQPRATIPIFAGLPKGNTDPTHAHTRTPLPRSESEYRRRLSFRCAARRALTYTPIFTSAKEQQESTTREPANWGGPSIRDAWRLRGPCGGDERGTMRYTLARRGPADRPRSDGRRPIYACARTHARGLSARRGACADWSGTRGEARSDEEPGCAGRRKFSAVVWG